PSPDTADKSCSADKKQSPASSPRARTADSSSRTTRPPGTAAESNNRDTPRASRPKRLAYRAARPTATDQRQTPHGQDAQGTARATQASDTGSSAPAIRRSPAAPQSAVPAVIAPAAQPTSAK